MSAIEVVDSIGHKHRFEGVTAVALKDDGSLEVRDGEGARRAVGAFAPGHWASWRRYETEGNIYCEVSLSSGACWKTAQHAGPHEVLHQDRGAGSKSGPPSAL